MEENRHDFAYIAMDALGMTEEQAYKWADEMLALIKKTVFQYAKEMGLMARAPESLPSYGRRSPIM